VLDEQHTAERKALNTTSSRAEGKVVIVTGAAGGIGAAACRQLVAAGARVVCADVDFDTVRELAGSFGNSAVAVRCDVASDDDARRAAEAAMQSFGALHALVNNAATFIPDCTVETVSLEDWTRTLQVNLTGAMLMSRHAVPRIRRQGGSIVHVASQLGHVAKGGRSWYCAAKGALIQLAKAMAIDHAPDGIRVNSLSPGPVVTERIIRRAGGVEAANAVYGPRLLTPRAGTPDDIAHAIVYLVSDESVYMTGSDLLIDGGYTAV
jgi:NAD(P)-dependent dehydrogenase (short-subunit alcohol dehydrogenase family)